jgi:hypothetical protein
MICRYSPRRRDGLETNGRLRPSALERALAEINLMN